MTPHTFTRVHVGVILGSCTARCPNAILRLPHLETHNLGDNDEQIRQQPNAHFTYQARTDKSDGKRQTLHTENNAWLTAHFRCQYSASLCSAAALPSVDRGVRDVAIVLAVPGLLAAVG